MACLAFQPEHTASASAAISEEFNATHTVRFPIPRSHQNELTQQQPIKSVYELYSACSKYSARVTVAVEGFLLCQQYPSVVL